LRERSINDITVTGNPTDVCCTEENFAGLVLEGICKGIAGVDHISSCAMHQTPGFAGRTRCVEDEQSLVRVHLFSRTCRIALRLYCTDLIVPPYLTPFDHGNRGTGTG